LGVHVTSPPSSTLTASGSFATTFNRKSTTYSLGINDQVILADATNSGYTLTLPTAVGIHARQYTIKRVVTTATGYALTVATTSSQTIDGRSTWVLKDSNNVLTVMSDGINWQV